MSAIVCVAVHVRADGLDEPTSNKAIQRVRKQDLIDLKAEVEALNEKVAELTAVSINLISIAAPFDPTWHHCVQI